MSTWDGVGMSQEDFMAKDEVREPQPIGSPTVPGKHFHISRASRYGCYEGARRTLAHYRPASYTLQCQHPQLLDDVVFGR